MAIHCKVASGTSLMKMAIYSDSSGSPSAKLGVTNEISVSNTTSAYQTASFASPVTLGAGDYWLTFMQDNAGTGFEYSNNTSSGAEKNNSTTTYPTFPDPFNSDGTLDRDISIYATYTPAITTSTSTSTSTSTTTTRSTSTSTSTTTLPVGTNSYLFDGTTALNLIQRFHSNGFEVGTDATVNSNGVIYYYFAFKKNKDFFEIANYTGDGNDDRDVGTIFTPDLVWVQKASGTTQVPIYSTISSASTASTLRFSNTSSLTDAIQSIGSFQIGTDATVNTSSATYYYFIWKNPSQSDFTYKYYEYKVFDGQTYKQSWTTEVLTQPSFRNVINGGPGEVVVRLARNFDDFGEDNDVKLNNRVDIWVYDRQYPNGQRFYRGFISGYRPVLEGNKEYVEITILSYIFELGYFMLRTGVGDTQIAYNSQDPSDILKDVIDKYRADGGIINYTATSIQDTNTTVSYTFNSNTVREAIDKTIELAPEGWYWTVDANSIIYLKPRPVTATHSFTIGSHIAQMETWRRIEDVVNRVYFTGFTTISGTGMYRVYSNSGSVDAYGLHAIHKVDHRVTNTSTADTMSNRILNAKSSPEIRTLLTIADNNGENQYRGYDIESIVPGDTMKIENIKGSTKTYSRWDQFTWDTDVWDATLTTSAADVIQILAFDYNPDAMRIEASSRLPEVAKRIEDIERNLVQNEVRDNPSSPVSS